MRARVGLARTILSLPLSLSLPFLLAPSALLAQALAVQVRDASHGIADATVTVLQGGEMVTRTVTDVRGIARVAPLPVGVLDVRVEALGYEARTMEGVTMQAGEVRSVEVVLTPRAVEVEGLTVETGRIQIQRENTEFSTQVEERAIQLLPLTHDAANLVELTAGARPKWSPSPRTHRMRRW